MKKLIVLLSVLAMPLLFTSCELFEDECEEVTHIETNSRVSVVVKDSEDGKIIQQVKVKINTWKTHCDGHKGYPPVSEWTGITNILGLYDTAYNFGYTMKTKKDFFTVRVVLYKSNGQTLKEYIKVYTYADVESNPESIRYIRFTIEIPFSAGS